MQVKAEKAQLVAQYEHGKKRSEVESVKLKERLQKLLQEKNNERKMGMQMLNALKKKVRLA